MRKIVLVFFFAMLYVNTKAQTSVYHPFPDSNAVWNVYFRDAFALYSDERYSYIITGDTIINTLPYHKLEVPIVITHFGSSPGGYVGAIRQNIPTKKVFYVLPSDTLEQLLYDFNLQVGDTVHRYVTNSYVGCYEDPQKIYAIDSVLVGGTYRKRWQVSQYFKSPPYFIEGIGSAVGLLEPVCHVSSDEPDYFLSCFTQSGMVLYHPDSMFYGMFSCDAILSVTNLSEKNNSISVYPNPLTSSSIIQLSNPLKDAELIIYDMLGKEMMRKRFSGNKMEIDFGGSAQSNAKGNLESGVYFVKVKAGEKEFIQKLIVE